MHSISTRWRRLSARFAIGAAVASFAMLGAATAADVDSNPADGIINSGKVTIAGHPGNLVTCSSVVVAGAPWTPSSFSFDISWVDPFVRAYFLADRSHGGFTGTTPDPTKAGGDVLMLDLNNLTPAGISFMTPPSTDPMAGIACDQNTAFGGTAGVGRNEITGPNGAFTVNHAEVWVGDGPSQFQPGQGDGTVTMSAAGTCGVAGVTCTYTGTASDYNSDLCNSSVRVFDISSRQQTDHINVGGCFRTDEGAFDPVDQIAVFANPSEQPGILHGVHPLNDSAFLTFISTRPTAPGVHHAILAQINFDGTHGTVHADGGIEQAAYNRNTGLFYVAISGISSAPNNGYVAVIDPTNPNNIHVKHIIPVMNCSPNGAVFGPDNELLLGCSGGPEQVLNVIDGHVTKRTSIASTSGGCDEVAYNAGDNHFLGACTDSNADSSDNLDISDADPISFDQAIDTNTKGAHSVAADPITVTDFVPAAAGTGANPNGLCGAAGPCILLFNSTGGDDPGERATEIAEAHQWWNFFPW